MSSKFYNNVKTAMLLGLLTALILLIGSFVGGTAGVIVALGLAGVMNFVAYFFSDKIALRSVGAQEVGPEHPLHRLVAPLAARAGLPMPRVYVSPEMSPNAFATGRNPANSAVCATEGLLAMLDDKEVAGVMAHELAHIKHRDVLITTIAATIASAISSLGYMFMFGGGHSGDDEEGDSPLGMVGGLLILLLGPMAAGLIQMAISRSREFRADTAGAEICGNPMWLASALERIHHGVARVPMDVNPAFNALMIAEPGGMGRSLANLFATHPPLEQRLMNLIGRETTGRVAMPAMMV